MRVILVLLFVVATLALPSVMSRATVSCDKFLSQCLQKVEGIEHAIAEAEARGDTDTAARLRQIRDDMERECIEEYCAVCGC